MAAVATAKKRRNVPGVVNGSLAYDFNTLERQLERTGRLEPDLYTAPLEETSADVISRAHEHAKARVRTGQRLSPVIALGYAALAVMLVALVMSYVELSTISSQVVSMQKELSALETDQVALRTKYEQAYDMATIKEAATTAGMTQPSESQIYYIDLSDPDNAVVYQSEKDGVLQWLEHLGQQLYAAVEYFR